VTDGWLCGTLPVLRSLKRHGLRVLLLSSREQYQGAGWSRYCNGVFFCPDVHEDNGGLVRTIKSLVGREKVDVILPLSDPFVELLAEHRVALESEVALAVPPKDAVRIACNKSTTMIALAGTIPGLEVPRTYHVGSLDDLARVAIETWPVVIKPRKSWGAQGIRWVGEPGQFVDTYHAVHRRYPLPIVQEFVSYEPGEKYQCLYLFDRDRRLGSWYMHRITHEMSEVRRGGRGVRMLGGSALAWESHEDREVLELGRQVFERLGWQGFGFLELVRDSRDGTVKIMEINPRLSGTISLPLAQGVDFAYDACCVALGLDVPRRTTFRHGVGGKHLLRGVIHALQTQRLRGLSLLLNPRHQNSSAAFVDPLPYLRLIGHEVIGVPLVSTRPRS
jgi:predicted ATP-grasp superfamily ATP-dependent carboligase